MKRTLAFAACGLVLALGCSNSKKNTNTPDSGTAGSGGSSGGTGGHGTGGAGGTGGKGGTGGGGGTGGSGLTTDQCVTMTTALTVPTACAQCVCQNDIKNSQACIKDTNCWPLLSYIGMHCPNDPMAACYSMSPNSAGIATVAAIGPTITMMCKAECVASTPPTDGGTDAGN